MTRAFIYTSIATCTIALVYGFAAEKYAAPAVLSGLLGIGWIVVTVRGFARIHGLAFGLFTILSVIGVWAGVSAWLSLAGVSFSLLAWDLVIFGQRLGMTDNWADTRKAERAHFSRLGLVLGMSLLGYTAATRFQTDLAFGAAALLALLVIWGISALVYRLRSHE